MNTTPSTARWHEQLERVARYRERVEELARGRPFDRPAAWFWDDLFAFFVECHSLKDWLIRDKTFLSSMGMQCKIDVINEYILKSEPLQLCADIANGKKHLNLKYDKKTRHRGWTGSKPELLCWIEVTPDDSCDEPLSLRPLRYLRELPSQEQKHEGRKLNESEFQGMRKKREVENLQTADRLKDSWLQKQIVGDDRQITIMILADLEHEGGICDYDNGIADLAWECEDAWVRFLRQNGAL